MAFISYSHADNREEGRKWADWLHTSLETYEIPEELVGKDNSEGTPVPRQIYPVFQDEKELSANASLSDSLKTALEKTDNLILLCSPKSANSVYVQQEIQYFKQIGRSKNIIALILSGEPQADGGNTAVQCFPEVLRYAVNSSGEILTDQPEEPIAADVRAINTQEGYTSPEAFRRSLLNEGLNKNEIAARVADYKDKLDNARLKVIAGVLKVPLGELTKRDKAYELKKMKAHNRNIKRIAAAISVLAIFAIVAGILAWRQKNKAEDTLARSLYQAGTNRIEAGDLSNGAAYIAAAARMGNDNAVLFAQSLLTNQSTEVKLPNLQYAGSIQYSPGGKFLAYVADNGITNGKISVWDAIAVKPVKTLENMEMKKFSKPQFDNSENMVYAMLENNNIVAWDFNNNKTRMVAAFDSAVAPVNFKISPDGNIAYLGFADKTFSFYHIPSGTIISEKMPLITGERNMNRVEFSKTGNYAVEFSGTSPSIRLSKIDSGKVVATTSIQLDTVINSVKFNNAGTQLALYNIYNVFVINLEQSLVPVSMNVPRSFRDVYFNKDGSVVAKGNYEYSVFNSGNGMLIKSMLSNRFLDDVFNEDKNISPDKTQLIKTAEGNVFVQNIFNPPMLQSQLLSDTNFVRASVAYDNKSVYILKRDSSSVQKFIIATGKQEPSLFKMKNKIYYFRRLKKTGQVYTISKRDSSSKIITTAFWDEKSGAQVGKDILLRSQSYNFSFKENGKEFMARVNDNTIGIYSVETGNLLKKFTSEKPIKGFMASPGLQYAIITFADKGWQVVSLDNKILKEEKPAGINPIAGAFATNEEKLAIRMSDGTVHVWKLPDMISDFKFPSQSTEGVLKFSPDGQTLAASDDINNIRLWNIKAKAPFGQVIKTNETINNFDWSPDGKRIYIWY